MNVLPAVFALAVMAAQTVAWADCCCGSFCRQKNACTGCASEPTPDPAVVADPCCAPAETPSQDVCSHLEPSTEIEVQAGSADVAPATALQAHAPVVDSSDVSPAAGTALPSRSPPSVRRHLRLSVLLI